MVVVDAVVNHDRGRRRRSRLGGGGSSPTGAIPGDGPDDSSLVVEVSRRLVPGIVLTRRGLALGLALICGGNVLHRGSTSRLYANVYIIILVRIVR